jgi:hypothetical protein
VQGVTAANEAYVLLEGQSSVLLMAVCEQIATPSSVVGRRVVVLGDGPANWIVVASFRP